MGSETWNSRKKSQSAIEFVTLASFMLLVVLGFIAVTSSNLLEAKEEGNKKTAQDIADFAYREIEIAQAVNNGYTRTFSLPRKINGADYSISVSDNRELTISYLGNEYVKFLPSNVIGNISKGTNIITKMNNQIIINASEVQLPPELIDLLMKNGNENIILFAEDGSVILKGFLIENSNPSQTSADEFVVKNAGGQTVAVINFNTGNMEIRGTLQENRASLNPSSGSNFIVKNNNGRTVSYIDGSGNFYMLEYLTQIGNP